MIHPRLPFERAAAIDRLIAHSNTNSLCRQMNISANEAALIAGDRGCITMSLTQLSLNIPQHMVSDWSSVERILFEEIKNKMGQIRDLDLLMALHSDALPRVVAHSMCEQIKRVYDEQGFVHWLFHNKIETQFQCSANLATRRYGGNHSAKAEFTQVTGQGLISCDQNKGTAADWLTISGFNLRIQCVAVDGDNVSRRLNNRVNPSELIQGLIWYGVTNQCDYPEHCGAFRLL